MSAAGAEDGILGERERPRAEHPEERAVAVPVDAGRGEERAEREEERGRQPADQPAEAAEDAREHGDEEPRLRQIQRDRVAPRRLRLLAGVVLGEAARRPVGLGRVAAARAVERRDVLERDEDVAVELDVRDVLDRAVRREDPSWYSPPKRATSTCSPLYLFV